MLLPYTGPVIGDRYKTQSAIRRKDSINEAYDFIGQTTFAYNMKGRRSHLWMRISVFEGSSTISTTYNSFQSFFHVLDGVVSFLDLDSKRQFNYTDTKGAIPVNYITFGGYRNYPALYQIDCFKAETKC